MSYLFDYGEVLICMAPIFVIMSFIFGALIWNNLPSRTVKADTDDDERKD